MEMATAMGTAPIRRPDPMKLWSSAGSIDPVKACTSLTVSRAGFATCVTSHKYVDWMQNNTNAAAAKHINGTPTLMVNGRLVNPATVANLTQAVG